VTEQELADAAQMASLAVETPEGRSIVVLAKEEYGIIPAAFAFDSSCAGLTRASI
jgi:high-affinity K+ transport system ATPase subunit B